MERTTRDVLIKALGNLTEQNFTRFRNKLSDWEIKKGFRMIPRSKLEKADREDVVDLILSHYMDPYVSELTVDVLKSINESQVALELKKDLENDPSEQVLKRRDPSEQARGHLLLKRRARGHLYTSEQVLKRRDTITPDEEFRRLYPVLKRRDTITPDEEFRRLYPVLKRRGEEWTGKNHFVDRHRKELMQRISLIDPVLDDLMTRSLLTSEQCDRIRAQPTPQDKMKRLFSYIREWSNTDKDILYNILKEHNSSAIGDLEERELTEMKHFVDRHRKELMQRISLIDPILDDLMTRSLLTSEQCDTIRAQPTPQDKMRGLYSVIRGWSNTDKDILYNLFKKHNPSVIGDLEKRRARNPQLQRLRNELCDESLKSQTVATLEILPKEASVSSCVDEEDQDLEEEDNDPDKNLLSRSRESLQSQGHALKSLSEESSISSQLDEVECNLCGKDQDPDDILIVPEINGNTYKLELTSAGLFRCSKTGIKFQVRHPVTMEYELDSWYNYMEFLRYLGSEVVGPLFNIKTPQEPDIVSAVYLPHYVCLKELSEGTSRIICAHFKDGNLSVEKPARILPFHVVLENPSFSPLGSLWDYLPNMVTKHIPIHGKVLLYIRVIGKNHVQYQIHLYLVPIFTTMSKDLEKEKEYNGFEKIVKPSITTSRIYTEKKFIVKGPKITHIMPMELEMLSISPRDNFTDIIINAPVDIIELCLVQKDSKENVWGCLVCTGEIEMLQPTLPKCKRPKEEMDIEDEQQTQPFKKAKVVPPQLTRSEQLLKTLQQLKQDKFEEFKMCLKNEEFLIRNQYDSMRTSELEKKNTMEVSELLIRRYTKERALPLTTLVLERIGEKQLAKNLRSKIGVE